MNKKSTTVKASIFILLSQCLLVLPTVNAQYCSPTFSSGCFSWRNQGVTLDAINWTIGFSDCSISDYTTDTAFLDAGTPYPMSVTNGDWCGCGVWVDLNQDFAFDTTENLFYLYTANATNAYNFNITIPASIPSGTYRMRVIAGWGTDCFTASANGYGSCGSYQYGNFNDFTVVVNGLTTGTANEVADNNMPLIEASPNPATDFVIVTRRNSDLRNATLQLTDISGKIIQTLTMNKEKEVLDVSSLSKGIYLLHFTNDLNAQCIKLVK